MPCIFISNKRKDVGMTVPRTRCSIHAARRGMIVYGKGEYYPHYILGGHCLLTNNPPPFRKCYYQEFYGENTIHWEGQCQLVNNVQGEILGTLWLTKPFNCNFAQILSRTHQILNQFAHSLQHVSIIWQKPPTHPQFGLEWGVWSYEAILHYLKKTTKSLAAAEMLSVYGFVVWHSHTLS